MDKSMIIKNLVYLSYGNDYEYKRAIFSVLSFFTWCSDFRSSVRIIIYTDAPAFFKHYLANEKIEYHLLSPQMLETMSGEHNFLHRRKVFVIGLTFEKYPNEDQLFMDSDTFFISKADKLLRKLDHRESFMHMQEYQIEEALDTFASFNQGHFPKALIDYISEKTFQVGDKMMCFSRNDYNWNSGVLGLNRSFALYMPDILRLTDDFYANSKWFLCEQLAFSFTLQQLTQIHPSDDVVCHYWGKRQKTLIDRLFKKDFSFNKFNDLDFVKTQTINLVKTIKNDLILEQIEIAVLAKSWLYAGKKIIQLVLRNIFDLSVYRQLIRILKR